MATTPTTLYAKTECLAFYRSGTGATHNAFLAGDYYTSLFKFLQSLTSSGTVDLVTYNTGSGGTGIGYWNETTRFGNGPFSVWRFKANGERSWDWYFYIHTNSGSSAGSFEETAAQTPTKVNGTAADGVFRSVIAQAAICVSTSLTGSVNFNPWGGTISSGSATKTTPVWNTGSNPDNKLFVFPRQNYLTGSSATNKDNCLYLTKIQNGTMPAQNRWNFFYDGHSLAIAQTYHDATLIYPRRYKINYFGTFRLANAITQSNQGNTLGGTGSLGFCMFTQQDIPSNNLQNLPTTHTMREYTTYGTLTPTNAVAEGGVFATNNVGVRTAILANDNTLHTTTYSPNPFAGNTYDERLYSVLSNEAGFAGFAGILTSPLIRCIVGTPASHDTSNDGLRTVIAANATVANRKITMPWTGSISPPGTNMTGDGITLNIPNYNW